jgi:hypothetical protein
MKQHKQDFLDHYIITNEYDDKEIQAARALLLIRGFNVIYEKVENKQFFYIKCPAFPVMRSELVVALIRHEIRKYVENPKCIAYNTNSWDIHLNPEFKVYKGDYNDFSTRTKTDD